MALGLSSRPLPTLKPFTGAESSSHTENAIPRITQRGLEQIQVASRGPDKHPNTRGVPALCQTPFEVLGGVIRLCHHRPTSSPSPSHHLPLPDLIEGK